MKGTQIDREKEREIGRHSRSLKKVQESFFFKRESKLLV